MKYLIGLICLCLSFPLIAQQTISVCTLPLNIEEELKAEDLETVVKRKAERLYRAEKKPFSQTPIGLGGVTLEYAFAGGNKKIIDTEGHALLNTLNIAYDQHRPMTISPDMVWLTIIQGVGIHLNKEIASLNEQAFYSVQDSIKLGKKDAKAWKSVFRSTNAQVKDLLGKEFHNYLFKRYSTSTWNTLSANNIAIVDDSGEVFSLVNTTACGIPTYTLEGSAADWKKLEKAAMELEGFELEWWTKFLIPVLEQFTAAAEGKADVAFWKDFYKNSEDGSGNELITGHVLQLFPYKKAGKAYKMNEMIGRDPGDESFSRIVFPDGREEMYKPIFTTANVPKGYGQTSLELEKMGRVYDMKLMSGFIGCAEDSDTKGLRPVIASWVMNEGGTSKPTRVVKVSAPIKEAVKSKEKIVEKSEEAPVEEAKPPVIPNSNIDAPPVGGLGGKKPGSTTIKVPLDGDESPRIKPTPKR